MNASKLGLVMVALACIPCLASAETILIDFGDDGTLTNWNAPVKNDTLSSVVDSDGNALAGVSITTENLGSNVFANDSTGYGGPTAETSDWLDADAVGGDVWYTDKVNNVNVVTISGLTGSAYRVDLIAARSSNGGANPEYRINTYYANGALSDGDGSETWSSYVDGWVAGGVMTWSSVTADNDTITMSIGEPFPAPAGNYSHWAAMRLVAVPEPASMGLLVIGGLAALCRRRRR